MTLKQTFETLIANATPIAFNPNWKNGTGYLDKATMELQEGNFTCIDDLNRRVLLLGTKFGTVAVFERFNPLKTDHFVLVSNCPYDDEDEDSELSVEQRQVADSHFREFSTICGATSSLEEENLDLIVHNIELIRKEEAFSDQLKRHSKYVEFKF